MRLFALCVLLVFTGCQKSSAPAPPADTPSFHTLTATEISDLGLKCTALGEKILKTTDLPHQLTGELPDKLIKDQLSRYDPKANRCYVQLTVQNANQGKADEYFERFLFDGQTGQVLASMRREKGVRSGEISNSPYPLNGNGDELYVDADNYITQMMAE